MPDLRVHGSSEASHEPDHYPPDVLVHDLRDLVAHLDLTDFDLGGFSLGARTSTRAVVGGMRPRRLISPVMAISRRTALPVRAEAIAVQTVMPAEGPSLGTAPSGK